MQLSPLKRESLAALQIANFPDELLK